MRNMIIKLFLLGLVLCVGKVTTLAQNSDIRCEVVSVDYNLSGNKYSELDKYSELGSFSLSEKVKKNGEDVVIKYYKLPRTKLILSIGVTTPKDEMTDDPFDFDNKLMVTMILGKKRILPPSSSIDEEALIKDVANVVLVGYPIGSFDKGGEGMLYMPYVGKKKTIHIFMRCKKEGK